jgi:hypothetical protein
MPIYDNPNISEYPYYGAFYSIGVDESKPLDEQTEEEVLVYETVCDIQRTSKLNSAGLLGAEYTIYFPLFENPDSTGTIDLYKDIVIRRGMTFRGSFYGYPVEGIVEVIRPSQVGGCSCDIKVNTET